MRFLVSVSLLIGLLFGTTACEDDSADADGSDFPDGGDDWETDTESGTDTDSDDDGCPDADTSNVDGWCLPHGAELCDDLGHFCVAGMTCCTTGCAPLGGDCCGDGTYCDPGYRCIGDGTCERVAADGNALYDTCAEVDQCFGNCFATRAGSLVATCLLECEHNSTLAALEQFKRYFRCNQSCHENTVYHEAYLKCFELNCAKLQYNCIGTTVPPN